MRLSINRVNILKSDSGGYNAIARPIAGSKWHQLLKSMTVVEKKKEKT